MKKLLIFIVFISLANVLLAQYTIPEKEIPEYKEQVKQMVNYLQETLNFIGDPANPVHEKDIIFKESFRKIFKDEYVQIEDDLDEDRGMSINKDVQAYLKDIDFFFHNVTFKFDIQKITPQTNEDGNTYFKVTMVRKLAGRTIVGDSINNTRNRFMEVNINPLKKELIIASIYTTKPNENEELCKWWNTMHKSWKDYLGGDKFIDDFIELSTIKQILSDSIIISEPVQVILCDSFMLVDKDTLSMDRIGELHGHKPDTVIFIHDTVTRLLDRTIAYNVNTLYPHLKELTNITDVNVSDNKEIFNLDPLSEMSELTYLDCSGTEVTDINPIRNLSKISHLDISNTNVTNITNLKYATNIETLRADSTNINNISVVSSFSKLKNLYMQSTDVFDLSPLSNCSNLFILNVSNTAIDSITALSNLTELYDLNVSYTDVSDLSPLSAADKLHFLNVEGTQVTELSPLSSLTNLNEINCSNTAVTQLMPLKDTKYLKRVYCDNSLVTKDEAYEFMKLNNKVLVINETKTLELWWEDLPSYWKKLLMGNKQSGFSPSKAELHSIIQIKSLKIDKNSFVLDLNPISRLTNLEELDLSGSSITDLSQLSGLYHLKKLDISNTNITNIDVLQNNKELKELNIENTKIHSLKSLVESPQISLIMAENSGITHKEVYNLKRSQKQVRVIYQTEELESWWSYLSTSWRDIFNDHVKCNSNPTAEQLQDIVDLEEIVINPEYIVYDIEPLKMLPFLKKLEAKNNQIHDISPLCDKEFLEVLVLKANPVDELEPLSNVSSMKVLDVENTAVDNLSVVANMTNLVELNVGGTSVSNLKPLADLSLLEELFIFNTNVKNISHIRNLPSLKHLAAYKTRIREKDMNVFREANPEAVILYY